MSQCMLAAQHTGTRMQHSACRRRQQADGDSVARAHSLNVADLFATGIARGWGRGLPLMFERVHYSLYMLLVLPADGLWVSARAVVRLVAGAPDALSTPLLHCIYEATRTRRRKEIGK